jgi:hypothetical protein
MQQMVLYSKIKQNRGGGECHSPMILHGEMTMCRDGRPRNIIMWTKGQG